MVKEVADHLLVVLFKKQNMDADKSVPVVNLLPVRFIDVPTRQGRTDGIQGDWDPEILVYVITTEGVPVEEALADIGMNSIVVMIRLDCNEKSYWVG